MRNVPGEIDDPYEHESRYIGTLTAEKDTFSLISVLSSLGLAALAGVLIAHLLQICPAELRYIYLDPLSLVNLTVWIALIVAVVPLSIRFLNISIQSYLRPVTYDIYEDGLVKEEWKMDGSMISRVGYDEIGEIEVVHDGKARIDDDGMHIGGNTEAVISKLLYEARHGEDRQRASDDEGNCDAEVYSLLNRLDDLVDTAFKLTVLAIIALVLVGLYMIVFYKVGINVLAAGLTCGTLILQFFVDRPPKYRLREDGVEKRVSVMPPKVAVFRYEELGDVRVVREGEFEIDGEVVEAKSNPEEAEERLVSL